MSPISRTRIQLRVDEGGTTAMRLLDAEGNVVWEAR
jgi:hypothetical protein